MGWLSDALGLSKTESHDDGSSTTRYSDHERTTETEKDGKVIEKSRDESPMLGLFGRDRVTYDGDGNEINRQKLS